MRSFALLLLPLAGCEYAGFTSASCDPRALEPGEVRARQLLCTDELVDGGEGHVGDWLIENAVARFVLRGTYSALYALDEQGGTLVDAVPVNEDGTTGPDVLGELRAPGDRSSVEVVNPSEGADQQAALVLPGMTWTLAADDPALRLTLVGETDDGSVVVPLPGSQRTGSTWRREGGFLGADGQASDDGLPTTSLGLSLVCADPECWSNAVYGTSAAFDVAVDAEAARIEVAGQLVARVPVVDGGASGWAPDGAELVGESDGCSYEGLALQACGAMNVRVHDDLGEDLASVFTVNGVGWVLPAGGGEVPAGLESAVGWLSAGPEYPPVAIPYAPDTLPGGFTAVTLRREMETAGAVWADLCRPVAPDPDVAWASPEATHDATGEGLDYVTVVADDEVPAASTDPLDERDPERAVIATAGVRSWSREGGSVVSWPWTANSKRPAHGVPPTGLSALDLLSVARNNSADRRTVVDRAWAEGALAEAPASAWADYPLAIRLDSLDDLPVYLALLQSYVPVVPVGARTWIELPTGDRNAPGVEAGIFAGETTAGNGPRIEVLGGFALGEQRVWDIVVHAARWMGAGTVTVHTPAEDGTVDEQALDLEPFEQPYGGGGVRIRLASSLPWVVVTVEGADGIWAVRGF